MMKQKRSLLEISNLSITYPTQTGKRDAVRNFHLSLKKGEVVALVGESGSGKTTAAMAVLSLLSDSAMVSGIIRYRGKILNLRDEYLMARIRGRKIGLIIQEPMAALNPLMKIENQVLEAVRMRKDALKIDHRQKVRELLVEVGLADIRRICGSYPHQLSGGQLQRVMIAIALAQDPKILIADEPTTALDMTVQKHILNLLKKLQQERKMAMILISHDLNIVAKIADRIFIMYQGSIMEEGDTASVLKSPQSPYTKTLLACRLGKYLPKTMIPVVQTYNCQIGTPKYSETSDSSENQSIILHVQKLSVNYRQGYRSTYLQALHEVSLDLRRGETIGVVGESGSGKSTLGKAIIGAIPLMDGKIEFWGGKMKKRARLCQMVFQNSLGALNHRLTVYQLLQEPFELILKESRSKVSGLIIKTLEEVGLSPEILNRYPEQLSGGQRQRVNIARALAGNPEILICDEAVSALDVTVQAQILNLLLQIQQQREISMIFISHDMDVIRHMSDRILVMKQGRVVEEGLAEQIFNDPRHPVTIDLIRSMVGNDLKYIQKNIS
jgi:ABC-type glutathione transport system ATPase component